MYLRIVAAAAPDNELVVLSRVRLGKGPVSAIAFSSSGSLVAAYSPIEKQLWLVRVAEQGRAQVLSYVEVLGECLGLPAWLLGLVQSVKQLWLVWHAGGQARQNACALLSGGSDAGLTPLGAGMPSSRPWIRGSKSEFVRAQGTGQPTLGQPRKYQSCLTLAGITDFGRTWPSSAGMPSSHPWILKNIMISVEEHVGLVQMVEQGRAHVLDYVRVPVEGWDLIAFVLQLLALVQSSVSPTEEQL